MNLEGEVAELDLIAHLVELGRQKFTGAIRFENDGVIKIIYFKGGDVLSASTNDRADSVDEILLRAGKVTREHVKQALAKRKENETLGDALLNLGFITRKELTWARRVQVIGVIRSIIGWNAGSFTMVADYLPKREEGTIFSLPQIIIELIVTEQDRTKFEQALEGGQVIFEKTPAFDDEFASLGLNDEAEGIAAEIDGTKNATDIAAAAGKDEFNAFKLLHALATLGLLTRRSDVAAVPMEETAPPPDDFASVGVADASEVWNPPAPSFTIEDEPVEEIALGQEPIPESPSIPEEASAPMPAWNAPVAAAPVSPPPQREEWGFDEAQIETAKAASVAKPAAPASRSARSPLAKPAPRKGGALRALMAVLVLAVLGGAGFAGWKYWQSRPAAAPAASTNAPAPTVTPVQETPQPAATAATPPALDTATTAVATTNTAVPSRTETTARTPAPQPVKPAAAAATGDATRERFDTLARDFARTPRGAYTVQIALVCQTASIEGAMQTGGNRVWFVPISYQGKSCYRLFWGSYDSEAAAQAGIAEIPSKLRAVKPVVVSVPKA